MKVDSIGLDWIALDWIDRLDLARIGWIGIEIRLDWIGLDLSTWESNPIPNASRSNPNPIKSNSNPIQSGPMQSDLQSISIWSKRTCDCFPWSRSWTAQSSNNTMRNWCQVFISTCKILGLLNSIHTNVDKRERQSQLFFIEYCKSCGACGSGFHFCGETILRKDYAWGCGGPQRCCLYADMMHNVRLCGQGIRSARNNWGHNGSSNVQGKNNSACNCGQQVHVLRFCWLRQVAEEMRCHRETSSSSAAQCPATNEVEAGSFSCWGWTTPGMQTAVLLHPKWPPQIAPWARPMQVHR